jgi:hypothetical protein
LKEGKPGLAEGLLEASVAELFKYSRDMILWKTVTELCPGYVAIADSASDEERVRVDKWRPQNVREA